MRRESKSGKQVGSVQIYKSSLEAPPVDYAKFESEQWELDYRRGAQIAHALLLLAVGLCIGGMVAVAWWLL